MSHDHDHASTPSSPFEELIKLQSAFQQSLSQATMQYLRQLQGIVGPVTPGTVVHQVDGAGVALKLRPGGQANASVNVENRQRVHSMVTPMITPLVSDTGATWFAQTAFTPPTALLATDEVLDFALVLEAPKDMPLGVYRGAVLIYGCSDGVVPLEVTVAKQAAKRKTTPAAAKSKTATKKASARKTAARKSTKAS
ncbi:MULTISPECIES: hypothetical protein [unclassified Ruegeria]|uniref:hypothetical protein n=1 Tax=unclassified Ruegeria TaxID=2625375 RepID=UPI001491BA2B|nr:MULTISPECIES: hypothetical protein [unclassified Ruegeria]NOD88204.1 hypothetical protein [Ruegeria sp. HKCCD4318]NOE13113.1 hypothetical protein [Ruegeria sp. HKCCD4318-2]NOG11345.1 hypothetical protein [Ruegeria sp. HKCCD4315]